MKTKKGFFKRSLTWFTVFTKNIEKVSALAVRWKALLTAFSAITGISMVPYFKMIKRAIEREFLVGTKTLTNDAKAAPLERTLADGTHVRLCYNSFIQYSERLEGEEREVRIGGQVEFDVARGSRPFVVHAGNLDIHVLGTHFNVKHYTDEPATVTLLSGKVMLSNEGKDMLMRPAQQATVKDGQIELRTLEHPERCLDWANKPSLFCFENASLNEVLQEVGHWYGLKISNPEKLSGTPISGAFRRTQSLDQVLLGLQLLEDSVHLSVKKEQDTIYVTKR